METVSGVLIVSLQAKSLMFGQKTILLGSQPRGCCRRNHVLPTVPKGSQRLVLEASVP